MSVTVRFEAKHAFVLRPPQVQKLWATLERYIGHAKAVALCTDGVERNFTEINDLLSYENSRARAISELTLTAISANRESRGSISFGGRYSTTISGSALGPEESVISCRQALEDTIDGCRPWFSPIVRFDLIDVVWVGFMFSFLVLSLMAGESKKSQPMSLDKALFSALIVVGVLAVIALVVFGLHRLQRRYFPYKTFALGEGESRFAVDENIRWVVIVGFVVSIFSSLVFGFLWS